MSGAPPPPANTGVDGTPEDPTPPSPTLAARLAEAEAALARTQGELEAARCTSDERYAARRATTTAPALHNGEGGAGGRRAGGPAADGAAGGPAPTATDAIITGDGTPAPTGAPADHQFILPDAAIRRDDYANVGDGENSESPSEWAGTRYVARSGRGGLPRNIPYADDVAVFNDGFDDVKVPAADE